MFLDAHVYSYYSTDQTSTFFNQKGMEGGKLLKYAIATGS